MDVQGGRVVRRRAWLNTWVCLASRVSSSYVVAELLGVHMLHDPVIDGVYLVGCVSRRLSEWLIGWLNLLLSGRVAS